MMTRARDFASVISGNFAIPAGSLGNAVPADGSITTAKLADDAITSAKIADDAVVAAAIADDAVTSAAIATNAVASDALNITSADLPSGTVLQAVTTNLKSEFHFGASHSRGDMVIATGLNASITPTSTNSKILYQCVVHLGCNNWFDIGIHIIKNATSNSGASTQGTTTPLGGSYLRDSNNADIKGDAGGGNPRGVATLNTYGSGTSNNIYHQIPVSLNLVDHPNSTSQQTYHFAIRWYSWASSGANWMSINRSYQNANDTTYNDYDTSPVSTVTLLEIA